MPPTTTPTRTMIVSRSPCPGSRGRAPVSHRQDHSDDRGDEPGDQHGDGDDSVRSHPEEAGGLSVDRRCPHLKPDRRPREEKRQRDETPSATRIVTIVIHRTCTPPIVTGSLSFGMTTTIFPIAPKLTSAMLWRR